MTVVSLAAAREERQPHWSGPCVCLGCRHEWEAIAPVGSHVGLECPACELPKGVVKYPFGPIEGDYALVCDCGCEALTAYKRAGHFYVKCMACGDDLTDAFFDG